MTPDLPALFHAIVRLEIELWNAVEHRLRTEHDVALSWYETLNVVDRIESVTVNDLVRELTITVGGASKLSDRIQSAGYLRRIPHPTDGRSSILELTTDGARLLEKLRTTVARALDSLIGQALPPDIVQRLTVDIGTLRSNLGGTTTTPESATR